MAKNGELSCYRCIFDQIKANLAEIQPEKRQKVLQEAPGVNGLIGCCIRQFYKTGRLQVGRRPRRAWVSPNGYLEQRQVKCIQCEPRK